jgi:hypothetical protein
MLLWSEGKSGEAKNQYFSDIRRHWLKKYFHPISSSKLSCRYLFNAVHGRSSEWCYIIWCTFFWVFPRRLNIYKPTFRNTLSVPSSKVGRCEYEWFISTPTHLWRWNRQSVPKRRLLIFRRRRNTQKKVHHIYNTAKVWKLRCYIIFATEASYHIQR